MFTLDDVLSATGGQVVAGRASATFERVAIDSRAVTAGDLFLAFRGQKHDGHEFVTQAFAHGARGALVEVLPEGEPWSRADWSGPAVVLIRDTRTALQELATYWRRRHHLTLVGVTGSVGKTSTKELIAEVLSGRFAVLRTPANLNTEIGVPLSLMSLTDAHQAAVVEMAMYDVGEIRRLAEIAQPTIGVVTNVQPSHLERLGTLDRIAEAKSELVRALPADGLAVLNADDERVRRMADLGPAPATFYGLRPDADIWADEIESHGLSGIELTLHAGVQRAHTTLSLLGAHSVHAVLAAMAVALHVGMSFDEAVASLKRANGGVRILVAEGIRGATVLDDTYNANPASTLAALNLLEEMEGRHVAVLGDMLELGTYEHHGHRLVGRRAATTTQWLITIGERARLIADEARAAGMDASAVESYDSHDQVIARLEAGLAPGDFVLVKGSRGMRLDEVVMAIRVAA